jgi:hypothetical protein
VELFLANGCKLIVQEKDAEQTSEYARNLYRAIETRDRKVLELLLEKGTDLDTEGDFHHQIREVASRWREIIKSWDMDEEEAVMQEISDLLLDEGYRLNALQLDGV